MRDVGERLVPGDTNEIPLTLPAFALQRVQHAIGVVHALEVVIHLRAERAAGERVRLIARELYGRPIPHFDDPRAGVRTVVPARATHHPQRRGSRGHGFIGHRSQDCVAAKDQVATGTRIRRSARPGPWPPPRRGCARSGSRDQPPCAPRRSGAGTNGTRTGRRPLVFVCKVILPHYNLPSENEVSMPVRVRS